MASATDTRTKVEEKVTDLVSSIQEPVVANVRKFADVAEQRINDFDLPAIEFECDLHHSAASLNSSGKYRITDVSGLAAACPRPT